MESVAENKQKGPFVVESWGHGLKSHVFQETLHMTIMDKKMLTRTNSVPACFFLCG